MSDMNMSMNDLKSKAARMVIGQNSTAHLEIVKEDENRQVEEGTRNGGIFTNHGGKLAIGVAAMLGLAIYYKWREQEVSAQDPDDSASLRRIKAIVEADDPKRDTE